MKQHGKLGLRGIFGGITTPPDIVLSNIVHPLHIGVPDGFRTVAGEGFIMRDPFSDLVPDLDPIDLFRRFDLKSKRISKYLTISRYLGSIMESLSVDVNEYVI